MSKREPAPSTLKRLNRPVINCRCGKVFSPTEEDARKVQQHVEKRKGRQNPVRFYQCRHRGWHWTQQLHEVTNCVNCNGRFRPRNDQPKGTDLCDTCSEIRKQEARRRRNAAQRARQMQEKMRMARTAQIIAERRPTPALLRTKEQP